MTLAMMLPTDDAERASALFDEAIELGTTIGDRHAVTTSNAMKALLAARAGQWRTALRASADAAEQQSQFGDPSLMVPSYWAAAVAFVGLGHFEPAAVLIAVSDALGPRQGPSDGMALAAETDAEVREGVGDERLAELRARGAALGARRRRRVPSRRGRPRARRRLKPARTIAAVRRLGVPGRRGCVCVRGDALGRGVAERSRASRGRRPLRSPPTRRPPRPSSPASSRSSERACPRSRPGVAAHR